MEILPKMTGMVAMQRSDKEISDLFIRTGRIQFVVLAFILTGFIVFGKQFIVLWAGADYGSVYTIALLFFIPLTVPLIQNLGISILMARNQMKFRSLLYIVIAVFSLMLSLCLAQPYGEIGCAVATALALCGGQIVGMNVYYAKKQAIDIRMFWKEIAEIAVVPLLVGTGAFMVVQHGVLDSWGKLILGIVIFSVVYVPLFGFKSMNENERGLILKPLRKWQKHDRIDR